MNLLVLVVLLLLSGLFSGLTLGILSLNPQSLKHKAELGDKAAARLLPLRQRGTQLLITLVLANVAVNAGITIMLDTLTPSIVAVIIATVTITVFGEILPQATIGRYGMKYAAPFAPLVGALMWLTRPVVEPAANFLDQRLGHELPAHMSKEELSKLVEEHSQHVESEITPSEQRIVEQALTLSETKIADVMTPRRVIRGVGAGEVLSPTLLSELHDSGHSRFPVYRQDMDHVVGTLFIKDLVKLRGVKRVENAMESEVYFVNEEQSLEHVLHAFLRTKHHLFMVINEFREVVGIITTEDVIEHILGREIVDEFDRYDDMRAVARAAAKAGRPAKTR
jgi:metal transporter CNNM